MVQFQLNQKILIKITGKGVDNYATGALNLNPDDGNQKPKTKQGVYAHFELNGQLYLSLRKNYMR